MRGRKPRPTALKILSGSQASQINRREPKFRLARGARPPAWLGFHGRGLWRRLAPLLAEKGVLTVGDLPAFENLCDEYDIVRRDPADNQARDRLRKWVIEFGLSPSSRSRISSILGEPVDELQAFLAQKRGR